MSASCAALGVVERAEVRNGPTRNDERLEWPHRPEGDERDESVVGADDALVALDLEREIVGEQRTLVPRVILRESSRLMRWLARHRPLRPDLSVRMRVAAPHHLALVLEDLHVTDV